MFKRAVLFGLVLSPALALAQKPAKDAAATGKPMKSLDSVMVKSIFYSALHEKVVENFPLATQLFSKVLETDANNDAAMYELANLKKMQKDNAEATRLLERATAINKDNEWYWIALADSYEKTNDLVKLENVFNQLIRIAPDKPDYYFDKANAYFIQKRYDEALAVYKKIESITGPTDDLLGQRSKIYLKQNKVDKSAEEIEAMIAANPGQIKYYLLLGEIYNTNNYKDKGLAILQKAEKVDPNNGMVHLALADVYRDKKNAELSYQHLEKAFAVQDLDIDQKLRIIMGYLPKFPDPDAKASALELSRLLTIAHPSNPKSFAIYGDMLAQSNKLKEARASFQKSIQLDDQSYAVQEQLVRLDLGENDLDAAIKDGQNALSLFPNQAWMNYLVGVAYLQKKNYPKAISYAKNATTLEFQDKELLSQAFSALGDAYHAQGDHAKSDESYDKSLLHNPDNSYTLNNYAYYLSLRGERLDKAATMSKRSTELQPNTASFEDTYAWILFKQKKYAEAKVWILKAISHNKDSATQVEHFGDIMFHLGDTNAAVDNWKKAKQGGATSPVLDRKINERKYIE
ncbi:tetratricopeptide repeat protein [Mucilaginibacter myungsuensis]|uniref:Tetratricopeptide repeat protein n=1 Tax=Mucilaginibacter myungsuensis TaxID=649104 RepID=A0A929KZ29_9SPHI|nr:tetratricopeptide repeat protein [Mucilaginibacter myungsuensis]MBE9663272.1 tetratricopeptide repeat protein [Mucilaginibacter myungsuensis]MDN3600007.1 tetratricopeptide repeat protein [Mucilaginibacter myungsuensis]